jgi:DNA polymerase III delta prime subunit
MPGLSLQELRRYVGRCNIHKPLAPDDAENLDIDTMGAPGRRPRGLVWIERLAQHIERTPPEQPARIFFSGLPGTGKTTELKRLARRLEDEGGAHLFPVYIDAEQVLDIHSPIDIPDLISALVYSAEKAVAEDLELAQDYDPMKEGYLKRLWHTVRTTDVAFDKGAFQLPHGVSLNFYMKDQPSFREQVRRVIGQRIQRFLAEAQDELRKLQGKVCAHGYEGMVLILDSLEKAGATQQNWRAVIQSIEHIFSTHAHQLDLPVHVLYTVPPTVAFRLPQQGVEFLPMIKLRELNGDACAYGVEAAQQFIFHRIPSDKLALLLGPEHFDARLAQLIQWSGGYPRELVRLLYDLLVSAPIQDAISEWDFHYVRNRLYDGYQLSIQLNTYPWLAQVAIDNTLPAQDNEHREEIDHMLRTQAVLRYHNSDAWFDLHPAVYHIPGVQEAIRNLKAQRAAASSPADPS